LLEFILKNDSSSDIIPSVKAAFIYKPVLVKNRDSDCMDLCPGVEKLVSDPTGWVCPEGGHGWT
jgi:hypothetical protein